MVSRKLLRPSSLTSGSYSHSWSAWGRRSLQHRFPAPMAPRCASPKLTPSTVPRDVSGRVECQAGFVRECMWSRHRPAGWRIFKSIASAAWAMTRPRIRCVTLSKSPPAIPIRLSLHFSSCAWPIERELLFEQFQCVALRRASLPGLYRPWNPRACRGLPHGDSFSSPWSLTP
jgi:hypothetical protein